MSLCISIWDPDASKWIVKARGETARQLVDPLGRSILDLRAVLDQDGNIIRLVSLTEQDPSFQNAAGENQQLGLVKAKFEDLPE